MSYKLKKSVTCFSHFTAHLRENFQDIFLSANLSPFFTPLLAIIFNFCTSSAKFFLLLFCGSKMAGTFSRDNLSATPPAVKNPAPAIGDTKPIESEDVPSEEEILSRPGRAVIDCGVDSSEEQMDIPPPIGDVGIADLRERWVIPNYVEMVPAGRDDRVQIDRLGFCMFYAYPFLVGYTLPLPMLVVDFCRYYKVCPA